MSPEPIDLDAAQRLVDAATEGPWSVYDRGVGYMIALDDGRGDRRLPEGMRTDLGNRADAEFIADARTLVPALIAELRETRAVIEESTDRWADLNRRVGILGLDLTEARRAYADAYASRHAALETLDRVQSLAEQFAADGDLCAAADIRKVLERAEA